MESVALSGMARCRRGNSLLKAGDGVDHVRAGCSLNVDDNGGIGPGYHAPDTRVFSTRCR